MRRLSLTIFVFCFGVLVFLMLSDVSNAGVTLRVTDKNVDGVTRFANLQAAVDAANAGDNIVVTVPTEGARLINGGPGAITIQGTGNAVVTSARRASGAVWTVGIAIGSGWVGTQIKNVTINAPFGVFSGDTSEPTVLGGSANVEVRNCTITGTAQGISGKDNADNWLVRQNDITLVASLAQLPCCPFFVSTIGITPFNGSVGNADNWEITHNVITGGDPSASAGTAGVSAFASGGTTSGTSVKQNRISVAGSAVQVAAFNPSCNSGIVNDTVVALNDFRGSQSGGTSNLDVFTGSGPTDVAGLLAFDVLTNSCASGMVGNLTAFGNIESTPTGRSDISQSSVNPGSILP